MTDSTNPAAVQRTCPQVESVWCDGCGAIKPVIYDRMKADKQNDHDATDIVCGECKLILLTLHHTPSEPVSPQEASPTVPYTVNDARPYKEMTQEEWQLSLEMRDAAIQYLPKDGGSKLYSVGEVRGMLSDFAGHMILEDRENQADLREQASQKESAAKKIVDLI